MEFIYLIVGVIFLGLLIKFINDTLSKQEQPSESETAANERYEELVALAKQQLEEYRATEKARIEAEIAEWAESNQEAASEWTLLECESLYDCVDEAKEELLGINAKLKEAEATLADHRAKVHALNEEAKRAKAVAEQKDFYRAVLTKYDLEDIEAIKNLVKKLHKKSGLNKLVWDSYLKQSVDQLAKNILGAGTCSGIYKFTSLLDGGIYIGKSVNVRNRLMDHYKAAADLTAGTDTPFHLALREQGAHNFTFELLEKCPPENLTEREKYYILLFESHVFGYNKRVG